MEEEQCTTPHTFLAKMDSWRMLTTKISGATQFEEHPHQALEGQQISVTD
jgi:hypothetical protein